MHCMLGLATFSFSPYIFLVLSGFPSKIADCKAEVKHCWQNLTSQKPRERGSCSCANSIRGRQGKEKPWCCWDYSPDYWQATTCYNKFSTEQRFPPQHAATWNPKEGHDTELFVQKPGNARALLVRNGTGNLHVSSPMFIRPRIKRKKTKKAETELLSGTPQKTFQAQGQPRDHLEKSKTWDGTTQVILSFAL